MTTQPDILPTPGYQMPSDKKMAQAKPALGDIFKRRFVFAGIWNAAAAAFALVVPWALVKVVDDGISARNIQALFIWIAAAVFAQVLAGVTRYFGACRVAELGLSAEKKRMMELFSRTMSADLRALPELAQGQVMGQIIFASGSERHFLELAYSQGIALCVSGLGTAAALLVLSWQLALLSFLLFPVAAVLWIWMKKKIGPAVRNEYEARESVYRQIVDIFRAMTSIRALQKTERFTQKFDKSCENAQNAGSSLQKKFAVQGPFFDIFQAVMLIAVFGAGGYGVMQNLISIGEVLGFQIYLSRLFGLMRSGTGIFGAWQQYIEGRARAWDIENLPPARKIQFLDTHDDEVLRVEDLSFAFDNNTIWEHESFVIHKGENKALLLPSGAGKTTLARCILGLYPVDNGKIAIPEGNTQKIGFVPQENVLFDGSVKDNIAMMCDELQVEKYQKLLYLCGLEELAVRFGDDWIGEQGARLSGGEQRRVMLARALASNPELLIIDQMASELEPELCKKIFERIREEYPQIGIFYLGHRMPEW